MYTVFSSAIVSPRARPGLFKRRWSVYITISSSETDSSMNDNVSGVCGLGISCIYCTVNIRAEVQSMSDKKLVVIATHAFEDPERATIPFVMANAALASETDVTVILQTTGVLLAIKDRARHLRAESFPGLQELMSNF